MADFEKWKYRYNNGYATENHIYRLVLLDILTKEQYKNLVGKEFV